jgi:hypothetical protein
MCVDVASDGARERKRNTEDVAAVYRVRRIYYYDLEWLLFSFNCHLMSFVSALAAQNGAPGWQ